MSRVLKELRVANELLFFSDGEVALQFLKTTSQKPFLILCDTSLPIINGVELRKQLNGNEYLRRKSIPFVFVTTHTNPVLVQAAYDETVQGYFIKPSTYDTLKEQLKLIIAYWTQCIHPNSDF